MGITEKNKQYLIRHKLNYLIDYREKPRESI